MYAGHHNWFITGYIREDSGKYLYIGYHCNEKLHKKLFTVYLVF